MKIISTTDISREGSACYIYESISLVEQFGIYAIIKHRKVAGHEDTVSVELVFSSTDCGAAIKKYDSLGGIIK